MPVLAQAARRTLDYVLRDMTHPDGGILFGRRRRQRGRIPPHPHEKSEGAFYIWTLAKYADLLGDEHAALFAFRYGVEAGGNVPNDPHGEFTGTKHSVSGAWLEETAHHFDRRRTTSCAHAQARRRLFASAGERVRPHLDDKILTAWNGLMISAFAKGAQILDEPRLCRMPRSAPPISC